MENNGVSTPPGRLTKNVNFTLQLSFVGLICFVVGLFAIRGGPPSKPSIGILDAQINVKSLVNAKQEADKEHGLLMEKYEQINQSADPKVRAGAASAYARSQVPELRGYALDDQIRAASYALDGAKANDDSYNKQLHDYEILKIGGLYVLPLVVCSFFLVTYYGTSFEVTPLTMLLPWLFKRRLDPAKADKKFDGKTSPADEYADKAIETSSPLEILRYSIRNASALATRMERRTNTHLILGVAMGLLGVVISLFLQYVVRYSFYGGSSSFVVQLINLVPRITILIFMEVLAGFFLRQYRIGVEDLKYFLDLERRAKARGIAYSIYGEQDYNAKKAFAAAILAETSQMILKEGETTTTAKVMENEANPGLQAMEIVSKQIIDLASKHIEALAKVATRPKT